MKRKKVKKQKKTAHREKWGVEGEKKKSKRSQKKKDAAVAIYTKVSSIIEKIDKKNVIHINKAGNLKSKLAKMINKM